MAVLEFEFKGIDQNFRSSASNVLNDIDKIKKAFSSIGVGIGVDLKTALDGQKVALNDTKIQTQELVKAGKELDNQNKQTRNSIAELTLEQKKLTAEQRASRANLQDSPYSRLSRELNEIRNEAKNLGAQMLKLSMRGDTTSKEYLKLEQAFNKVQSKITPLDSSLKKLDSSLGQNQRRVGAYGNALGGFESAQGSANGVALEFTRIIQDAPYGMMGIGNNIQQLTSNFGAYRDQLAQVAAQQGKTLTSMQMFQGIATSFLSTGNLIALAVAGITSAWTYYTMQQQKANKATKEAKEATEDFRKSLDTLSRVQLEASTNATKDLTRLKMLSVVYKDNASSSKQRELALNGIVNLYKTYFPNLTLEQAKIEALSGKYAKLTEEILRTSRARGYEQILAEKQTDNINALAKQSSARNNINKAIDEYRKEVEKGGKKLNKTNEELFSQFYDQLNTKGVKPLTEMPKNANSFIKASVGVYQAILKYNGLQRNSISTQQSYNEIFQQYLKDVKDGKISIEEFNTKLEDLNKKDKSKGLKEQFDYLAKIRDLLGDKQEKVAVLDLKGEQKELKELEFSYADFFNKLTDLQNKLSKDKSVKNKAEIQEQINNARELGEKLKESQRELIESKWIEERTKLIDEMYGKLEGVAQTPLEKKFADWAKEVEKFKNAIIDTGNPLAQFQSTLDELTQKGNFLISAEEGAKNLKEWQDNNDKIAESINKPFGSGSQKKLQQEMQNRLKILEQELIKQQDLAQKYFTDYKASDLTSFLTEIKGKWQLEIDAIVNAEQAKKDIQDYVSIANNGLNSVFTNLKSNIDEFGLKARSVFYTLGETLGDLIKQLANKNTAKFMEQLTKDAKSFSDLKDNWKEMSSKDKWSAGLGFSGGAITQLTPQTSVGGQAIGGALSGAAAGMAFGPWGAAIGAVAGGVSGLLKASKNRKQEKILLQQYEEQKKANALLERMNALTYASQIIGQKTQYGIVSGVRRNEFGEIVTVVQGQDIVMVAERTNSNKNR